MAVRRQKLVHWPADQSIDALRATFQLQVPDFTSFTPAEDVLSASMARYWGNFAKTGKMCAGSLGYFVATLLRVY